MSKTNSLTYTQRLIRIQGGFIKKLLWPVNPYKWNIRRVCKGRVLDVGCGIGRNLKYLGDHRNVGVDHNPDSVEISREIGFKAFTPDDFHNEFEHEKFKTLLLSHVIEHLTQDQVHSMLEQYLPYLENNSRLVIICPQQRGFASDITHVTYFDENSIRSLLLKFTTENISYKSFPLPKIFGKSFIYNEHIAVVQFSAD
jgi:SAM-dependent methyltransferase